MTDVVTVISILILFASELYRGNRIASCIYCWILYIMYERYCMEFYNNAILTDTTIM